MKVLALIGAEEDRLPLEALQRREAADEAPRVSLFESVLHADVMGARMVAAAPPRRRWLYRIVPRALAQPLEAFFLRDAYDAIVSWSEEPLILFALILKLARARKPHVGICYWISPLRKALLLRFVESHIDRFCMMSSSQREFALEKLHVPRKKIVPLRWFVDQRFWRPMEAVEDIISSSGREFRDYATLVEALRGTLISCHIAAKVTPGKKDEWIADLRREGALPPNVRLGINETLSEVRQVLARSRFVVVPLFPCDQDVGSTVILEAMAMGKPVIVSRIEGQRDIVQHDVTGIYVPPGDPIALREAILSLWNDPQRVVEMGKRAREYVEQYHTFDAWVDKVKHIVEEVIAE